MDDKSKEEMEIEGIQLELNLLNNSVRIWSTKPDLIIREEQLSFLAEKKQSLEEKLKFLMGNREKEKNADN